MAVLWHFMVLLFPFQTQGQLVFGGQIPSMLVARNILANWVVASKGNNLFCTCWVCEDRHIRAYCGGVASSLEGPREDHLVLIHILPTWTWSCREETFKERQSTINTACYTVDGAHLRTPLGLVSLCLSWICLHFHIVLLGGKGSISWNTTQKVVVSTVLTSTMENN